ncbi:tyrosine-type recombinase/integrase [Edaphobacter aggregans]|uniref:tyrosine-type recombinase/integrase n=1 Tax=Edaphobacter aggregans TaxID=570835 RepID=UPI00068AB692|nr:tyrosine-type recombinase/integrase [Edaphobacter aggregans]
MSQNYQHGYLRRAKQKSGPHRWEFLWREHDETGKWVRRTTIIGTVEQYPTEEQALAAANGLKMQINADRNRHPVHSISIGNLIDHYVQTELLAEAGWHSHATKTVYRYFLKKWIRPHWGEMALRCVRTIAVEHWLRQLQRADGIPLANPTKAKIRNIFSVLFNHAIRCEWLEQGENPITLVRQSAMRMNVPEVLESSDIQALLVQLDSRSRLMVTLAVTTGLRRSELFALRWGDVNFSDLEISVRRSIYLGTIGDCKTEASANRFP